MHYSGWGMLRLLKRLGLSRQKTRPRHPEGDPAARSRSGALDRSKKGLGSKPAAIAAAHPDARLQLWCQDEARVGQKGRTRHRWYRRGVRPPGLADKRFDASLAQFAGRHFEEAYPYLILDARCGRVREAGVIRDQAVPIAVAVGRDGRRAGGGSAAKPGPGSPNGHETDTARRRRGSMNAELLKRLARPEGLEPPTF